jgi:FkbM family methyltransferase
MSIPHYKISYAQNFEDLVLAGLLKSVTSGFYIDVGANHPELDSVTKIFYDKGWSGINVEPNGVLHQQLMAARPRDVNVHAGLSSQPGVLTLRVYEGLDGLSTMSHETQSAHAANRPHAAYKDIEIKVACLADLIAEHRSTGDIHMLKVDVEGMELEVLLGNDWQRFRPWVLCLERNQDQARRDAITSFMDAHRYTIVYFDGINDFMVAEEQMHIWDEFSYAKDVILDGVPVNYIFVKAMMELSLAAAK